MELSSSTIILLLLAGAGLLKTVAGIVFSTAKALIREYRDFRDWNREDERTRLQRRT